MAAKVVGGWPDPGSRDSDLASARPPRPSSSHRGWQVLRRTGTMVADQIWVSGIPRLPAPSPHPSSWRWPAWGRAGSGGFMADTPSSSPVAGAGAAAHGRQRERLPSLRRGGSHPPSPISAAKPGRPWCSSRLLLRSRAVLWCCRPHGEAVIARVRGESSAWLGQVNDGGASGVTFFLGSVVSEPWSPSSDSGRKPRLRCL